MGLTAAQGYADGMARAIPEPMCTGAYYDGMLAAVRERLWKCAEAIRETRDDV
jgi:hypothetical protein